MQKQWTQVGRGAYGWTIAAGVLLTLAWELILSGIEIGDRVLHPGMPAYVALMFLALRACGAAAGSGVQLAWFGLSAVVLSDLPLMATRASLVDRPARDLVAGALVAAVVLVPLAAWAREGKRPARVSRTEVMICWAVAMAAVAAFQGFNRSARAAGIPNEERSLMAGGVEWHHINWGLILLVIVAVAWASLDLSAPWRRLFAVVIGLAVGMVVDQWYYYMAQQVTDDAYFAIETWASALVLGVALLGVWLVDAGRTPIGADGG